MLHNCSTWNAIFSYKSNQTNYFRISNKLKFCHPIETKGGFIVWTVICATLSMTVERISNVAALLANLINSIAFCHSVQLPSFSFVFIVGTYIHAHKDFTNIKYRRRVAFFSFHVSSGISFTADNLKRLHEQMVATFFPFQLVSKRINNLKWIKTSGLNVKRREDKWADAKSFQQHYC